MPHFAPGSPLLPLPRTSDPNPPPPSRRTQRPTRSHTPCEPPRPPGSQLEAGDVRAASSTLGGGWVDDFKRASDVISTSDDAKGATKVRGPGCYRGVGRPSLWACSAGTGCGVWKCKAGARKWVGGRAPRVEGVGRRPRGLPRRAPPRGGALAAADAAVGPVALGRGGPPATAGAPGGPAPAAAVAAAAAAAARQRTSATEAGGSRRPVALLGGKRRLADGPLPPAAARRAAPSPSPPRRRPQALFDGIAGLRSTAGKGDLKATKQQYVAVVGSFQKWAAAAGVAGDLKGL